MANHSASNGNRGDIGRNGYVVRAVQQTVCGIMTNETTKYGIAFLNLQNEIEDIMTTSNPGWIEIIIEQSARHYDKYAMFEKVNGKWKRIKTIYKYK